MSKEKKDIVHKDLLIKILEHCYKKGEFTIQEMQKELDLSGAEVTYINKYKSSSGGTKQMFEYTANKNITIESQEYNVNAFRLTPTAIFNYLEYVEIVAAKKNAISSKKLALWAILISVTAILTPIIIQVIQSFQTTS